MADIGFGIGSLGGEAVEAVLGFLVLVLLLGVEFLEVRVPVCDDLLLLDVGLDDARERMDLVDQQRDPILELLDDGVVHNGCF